MRALPRSKPRPIHGQRRPGDNYADFVICPACREGRHQQCRGGNWCDCQHRPTTPSEPATGPPGE